jgi:hypothetical protein
MWEWSGNLGIGPGFLEGIQVAAIPDVKAGRRSNPCFSYDHVFAMFLRYLWEKAALGVGAIKTRSVKFFQNRGANH